MTFKLLFQMVFGVFSFNPKNMRWFNLRRILMVLFLVPFFITILIINRIFLLLDFVFFPHFLWQKTKNPVFIISAPRSATTYMFHTLAKSDRFTCFKLWEIIFAPAITQKYIILGFLKLDGLLGNPVKKLVLFMENVFIGKLKKIHLIGLNLPEEDEAVLLWSLSSFYLNFFYPDSNYFDDLVLFDKSVSEKRKARIMRSYANYIKRHNFVFNRKGNKQYLSKNPLMMCKVGGVASIFPDAQLININRCPSKIIPSTQELNRTLYALFTSRPVPQDLVDKTTQILIQWYQLCETNIKKHFADQHIKVDFKKLVTQDPDQIEAISTFLDIPSDLLLEEKKTMNKTHKSSNSYTPLTDEELNTVLKEIPFMSIYSNS